MPAPIVWIHRSRGTEARSPMSRNPKATSTFGPSSARRDSHSSGVSILTTSVPGTAARMVSMC